MIHSVVRKRSVVECGCSAVPPNKVSALLEQIQNTLWLARCSASRRNLGVPSRLPRGAYHRAVDSLIGGVFNKVLSTPTSAHLVGAINLSRELLVVKIR